MKTTILILMVMLFCSCNEQVVLDEEQRADATTVALQRVAMADSTTYHVVFNDDELIVLDDDYMVIAKGFKEPNVFLVLALLGVFLIIGILIGTYRKV